jgi:transposase
MVRVCAIILSMSKSRDFGALEKRRLRGFELLERGLAQAEVARRTGVSRQSVLRWNNARLKGGKEALKGAGRAGRKPRMNPERDARLVRILSEGAQASGFPTPLWTLERVAKVIRREFGIRCHSTTALRILRHRINWSCQKPIGRAIERDETAIAQWKRKGWPALKKRRSPKAAPSSLSTKAA